MIESLNVSDSLAGLRKAQPLIHNITNYVVMNFTANALLSIGASPVMAHAPEEVEDMARLANALVINIGTLDDFWVKSMAMAMRVAKSRNIPIIFDPVGVGATKFRNEVALRLIEEMPPDVIRGNASEILSLAKVSAKTKGVDSLDSSEMAIDAARTISGERSCVVCVSGATDYIVERDRVVAISNGDPMMTKVTGMGCAATALIGAFSATQRSNFLATQLAMIVIGVAGEIAKEKCQGPGSFALSFLDTLSQLDGDLVKARAKLREHV